MAKIVPQIGAKIDFKRGFKADAPKPRKSVNGRKRLKKLNFKGGFYGDGLKLSRKRKGKWTYNDTRDYRFDPDKFII